MLVPCGRPPSSPPACRRRSTMALLPSHGKEVDYCAGNTRSDIGYVSEGLFRCGHERVDIGGGTGEFLLTVSPTYGIERA